VPKPQGMSREQRRMVKDFIHGGRGGLALGSELEHERRIAEIDYRVKDVRGLWLAWIAPRFKEGAVYFTGTYSEEYGYANGLMSARNVHKDFRRFLAEHGMTNVEFVNGVEKHQYRDILHCHGIIAGEFTDLDRYLLDAEWQRDRGFCRVLPVLDGCASYVTKYALKNDTDNFDWNLS